MKIGPVIVEGGKARVCQRCLVKWARVRVLYRVYCNPCGKASAPAARSAKARGKGEGK